MLITKKLALFHKKQLFNVYICKQKIINLSIRILTNFLIKYDSFNHTFNLDTGSCCCIVYH